MAVFCTDAGHGGSDSGAVWKDIREKDLNLQVTLKLNRLLKERGHTVWTTRRSDEHVPPLSIRCRLINRHYQLNRPAFDAIVSLHCNVAAKWDEAMGTYQPLPRYRGLYAIYSEESVNGKRLARLVAEHASRHDIPLAHHGTLSTVELGRSLAWIHQTRPVSVLVEMGFMTNPEELARLQDEAYQQILAQSIADALEAFVQQPV
jgi:N-acetylmuramoyl-L-alanine amidase